MIYQNKLKGLNTIYGLLMVFFVLTVITISSCKNNKEVVENYGIVTNPIIYNIYDLKNNNENVFTTGFVRDDKGITYISDDYTRVSMQCIKKIDGIEYVFDYYGYLAKSQIVEDISYPNKNSVWNNHYPRLADENGVYITDKGIYKVNDKIYFIENNGYIRKLYYGDYILYDNVFYTYNGDENDYYSLRVVSNDEIISAINKVMEEDTFFEINNYNIKKNDIEKLIRTEDGINEELFIKEFTNKYDCKNDKIKIAKSDAINTEIDENKFGFQNVLYNDYIKNGVDDIWWDNYYNVSYKKSKIYLKKNGKLAQDEIIKINNKKYLFDKNNLLVINSAYGVGNKTYLTDKEGMIIEKEGVYLVKNVIEGTYNIDIYNDYTVSYYVNKNGLVEKNKYILFNNDVYFADNTGILYKNNYKDLLYFDDECKLDKECIYKNEVDFDSENKDLYIKSINRENKQKAFNFLENEKSYSKVEANNNFKVKVNNSYIDIDSIKKYDIDEIIIEDKNGHVIQNKFVNLGYKEIKKGRKINYMYYVYYIGELGKIIYNRIVDINGKKYIFDNEGKQIKHRWLGDSDFYENENKKSDNNPYISGFNVKRNLIKEYIGYYVNDYLILDDVKIEQSYVSHLSVDYEDSTRHNCYIISNGKYIYDEDERQHTEWTSNNIICNNYERKQIDEGIYKFVHIKKGRYSDATFIDETTLAEQLSRYTINDIGFNDNDVEKDETVKFGTWYLYDKTGTEKDRLRWHIIKKDKNKALLISEDIIDIRHFHNESGYVAWSNSDLRKWLNEEFYNNAFTNDEKKYIYSVKNENSKFMFNNNDINYIGESIDKVFILPQNQIDLYLKDDKNNLFIEIVNTKLSRYSKEKLKKIINEDFNNSSNSYLLELLSRNNLIGVRPAVWVKFNNRDNNEYGSEYNQKEDLYYQSIINEERIVINDIKEEYYKKDLNIQVGLCKTVSNYNDGEVIEEIDHIVFGEYEIDGADNGKEGIKWVILDKDEENNRALVMSKYVIEASVYHNKTGDVTWETSYIRKWLNSDFYNNAFNNYEQDLIEEIIVQTKDEIHENYMTKGGNVTKDKVFLLSTDEIEKYLFQNKNLLCASVTMDINKEALYSNSGYDRYLFSSNERYIEKYDDRLFYADYLTRSPGVFQDEVKVVQPYYYDSFYSSFARPGFFSDSYIGIRPAMWVKLKK